MIKHHTISVTPPFLISKLPADEHHPCLSQPPTNLDPRNARRSVFVGISSSRASNSFVEEDFVARTLRYREYGKGGVSSKHNTTGEEKCHANQGLLGCFRTTPLGNTDFRTPTSTVIALSPSSVTDEQFPIESVTQSPPHHSCGRLILVLTSCRCWTSTAFTVAPTRFRIHRVQQ